MAIDVLKNYVPGVRENGIVTDATVTLTGTVTLPASQALTTPVIGAATGTSLSTTGSVTTNNAGALTSGGNTTAALLFSGTASFGIYFGAGAPTISAAKGSLYLASDGSSSSTRLYINSSGSTTWVAITTAS